MELHDYKLPRQTKMLELVHNAMLMGTHKNKKFLQFLFEKEYLMFPSHSSLEQRAVDQFFMLLDLFEAKYKKNYDLGFESTGSYLFPIFKVIYPEFTITNSAQEHHLIRDLIVVHKVDYSSRGEGHIYTKHPQGGRLSKTVLEIASSYQQSHLPGHEGWNHKPFHTTSFCVGGDTDVSRMIAEFEVEMDWDRYELYLFCVDSMVTWESLEGVPFRKMRDIKNALNNKVTTANSSTVNAVVNHIVTSKLALDLDFYIEKNRFKIRPNERANEFVKSIILNKYNFDKYKNILVTRVPNTFDEFFQMKAESLDASSFDIVAGDQYVIFRGEKKYARKIKEDQRQQKPVSIDDYIVYPKFLKDVLKQLECRIYEKAITKSGIKIQNSRSNANRGVTSDSISM